MTLNRYAKYYHFCLESGAGLNPTLFPADDVTHYVRAGFVHDIGLGNYIIEVNPFDDTDGGYLMQRFMDGYYSGAKKDEMENIDLKPWVMITKEFIVGEDSLAITYPDLYLDWTLYGLIANKAFPAIIPQPSVGIHSINNDASGIFIHSGSVTTAGFTVSRKTGWEEDNVKVQFKIIGG